MEEDIKQEEAKEEVKVENEPTKEELKAEIESWKKSYAIKLADFDNYKKRVDKDFEEYKKYACEKLILETIKNLDLFEKAVEGHKSEGSELDGFKMILKNMKKVLEDEGVEKIETQGQKYDPYLHQALMTDSVEELENDMITMELQSGYKLKGKVIRPAMVKINKK